MSFNPESEAMDEGDFDPEMMLDQEEYMNFVGGEAGEAGKNIQQLLKESLVDKDFYNDFDDDFDDDDLK
ncbi:hypothetical protein C9374_000644 [Naegleria lovaniensis]|uniref:Uncharacterized protein n=1 Tax=Naegleria lovaniensis TaxID=51637 RepID=A0AA88KM17_NAELO|nr:uncharacterized protein C9374_000644 [Naegleria lovaniensis]KAG2388480.1 hypothetical protein C9374_000644 [Naegleria lovaniensis]